MKNTKTPINRKIINRKVGKLNAGIYDDGDEETEPITDEKSGKFYGQVSRKPIQS